MEIFRNIILVLGAIFFGGIFFIMLPCRIYIDYGIVGIVLSIITLLFCCLLGWAITEL